MTPKEKAEELVHRFQETMFFHVTDERIDIEEAKQCALIAVKFARENPLNTEGYNKYLDEVKQEIQKL
jgi:hypothetical protein